MRALLSLYTVCVLSLNNGVGRTPAMGFSTWNTFGPDVSDSLIRETADAMASNGLLEAGYEYLNLDDGWCVGRDNETGVPIPDPKLFPFGMKPMIDYVHSKGLKFGIYTARGSLTCCGRPGSDMHEVIDAQTYAAWGVDYLKEDSCGGHTTGTMWEQYVRMRDALNATGRPIYFSITQAEDWADGHPRMHCYGDGAFSTLFWTSASPPLDPRTLANSYLVEYCNNEDFFGYTDGVPKPGGFLSNLDSQQLLTTDEMTTPGAWNDNDMLEVCHSSNAQTDEEYEAQFSTWSILASPLILGNDVRNISADCAAIILNKEVIAVNQDTLGARGRLVLQWPEPVWPAVDPPLGTPAWSAGPAPVPTGTLVLEPCNSSDPAQMFTYLPSDGGQIKSVATGDCLTYGGYEEANFAPTACVGWTAPGIGSQLWTFDADPWRGAIQNVDNSPKVVDVIDCNVKVPPQVCSANSSDCYTSGTPPAGCGATGQRWLWDFGPSRQSASTLQSAVAPVCIAVQPLPPPPIDIRLQIWVKPLSDGARAVVAFNRDTVPYLANITWDLLEWPATQQATIRDLWAHTANGTVAGIFSAVVAPHAVVMLRISPLAVTHGE